MPRIVRHPPRHATNSCPASSLHPGYKKRDSQKPEGRRCRRPSTPPRVGETSAFGYQRRCRRRQPAIAQRDADDVDLPVGGTNEGAECRIEARIAGNQIDRRIVDEQVRVTQVEREPFVPVIGGAGAEPEAVVVGEPRGAGGIGYWRLLPADAAAHGERRGPLIFEAAGDQPAVAPAERQGRRDAGWDDGRRRDGDWNRAEARPVGPLDGSEQGERLGDLLANAEGGDVGQRHRRLEVYEGGWNADQGGPDRQDERRAENVALDLLVDARAVAEADGGPRGRRNGDARREAEIPRIAIDAQLVRQQRAERREAAAARERRIELDLEPLGLHADADAEPVGQLERDIRIEVDGDDFRFLRVEHARPERVWLRPQPERDVHG